MQIDVVRICNMALRNVGAKNISSLEQPGKEAVTCKDNYDIARLTTLEGALWNFASGWRLGVKLEVDPKPPWCYVYSYPNEALKVFRILRSSVHDPLIPMEVTDRMDGTPGKIIQTNQLTPVFEFTVDKEDVSTFSWEFIRALSWQLSSLICMPLTKNVKLLEKCEKNAVMYTSIAEASTMNEQEPEPDGYGFYHDARDQ
ncbi:hypothetical protein [uncultured Paraglaciecola sp.]|uniref:hypothetical protein n=1 Tax=uncultured Paraglaciecola sp. TaxID=1765024 RepID=UPI0026275997|nr:hypothetical protein [uncultured Paraglaciecola sp.]